MTRARAQATSNFPPKLAAFGSVAPSTGPGKSESDAAKLQAEPWGAAGAIIMMIDSASTVSAAPPV